jgi:lipopolysaccharide export system protein LptC
MTDRILFWFPLAVLGSLALLTFWLAQTIQEAGARKGVNQKEPDSIVENFRATSTDATGTPRYRLSASKLRHFSDSKMTLLDRPSLTQIHAKHGELKITSSTASVSPEGEKVVFSGDVSLSRQSAGGKGNITMKTAYLEVLPEKGVASTRKPIVIEQPGMRVTANGLNLSANTRVLKLTGRVKVQYQSPRRA